MIQTRHKLSYCQGCETEMILCKTCGNNCCNAAHGEVNGEPCPDCSDAYIVQSQYWNDPASVEFLQ